MVIEKARELGVALSETEEFKKMLEIRTKLNGDESLKSMVADYSAKQEEIMELLSSEDPDGERIKELSGEIDSIQSALSGNEIFTDMIDAQNDFQQLMDQVNHIIGVCIGMEEEPDYHHCDGGCATCGSCKH